MSESQGLIAGVFLLLALLVYTFWPENVFASQREKTRLDFLLCLRQSRRNPWMRDFLAITEAKFGKDSLRLIMRAKNAHQIIFERQEEN